MSPLVSDSSVSKEKVGVQDGHPAAYTLDEKQVDMSAVLTTDSDEPLDPDVAARLR